jgi:hypothetical protein
MDRLMEELDVLIARLVEYEPLGQIICSYRERAGGVKATRNGKHCIRTGGNGVSWCMGEYCGVQDGLRAAWMRKQD